MKYVRKKEAVLSALFSILFLLSIAAVNAQTTEFTYQGRLLDNSMPTTGTYDFQFTLWDTLANGTQVGTTQAVTGVAVAGGIFTVKLDFGPTAFADGAARFLEIEVKPAAGGTFTTLSPRQALTSAPHSIRSLSSSAADSLSAQCVNCVTSAQIQSVDGTQITGTIPPEGVPSGSENYIQNTSVPRKSGSVLGQPAASLNIGGNATVGSMDVNGPISIAAIAKPGMAPAGQGRIYFDSTASKIKVSENGGAFVDLVGAGGVSGSGAVDAIPLWSAGTTLGNSLISQVGGTDVFLPAAVNLAATASGNNIRFGSPNSGTGMTISGPTTRADVRLDTNTLRLAVGAAGGPPGNGIGIDALTVSLPAFVNLAATASGNNIAFGSPNSGTGMTIQGPTTRADVRLDGNAMNLMVGASGVGPPGNGISINASGNVGIGTVDLLHRFSVHGAGFVETNIKSANERAILSLDSTISGSNRIWTLESGLFGTPGLFGIYDKTAQRGRLTIDTAGTVSMGVLQITGGSDLAENFEFADEAVKPGLIVAIDQNNAGKLVVARGAYNRRVAGIISGANNLSTGMILPDVKNAKNSLPVALSGRVWVFADANQKPIKLGDLLTTSGTKSGYAMKVTNYKRSQGAIIGKAMTGLKSGTGLVLVLVSLQ